jgi:hypothetical protein
MNYLWSRLKLVWIGYKLTRTFGNGVLVSIWREIGTLFVGRAYLSPKMGWRWPPRETALAKPEPEGKLKTLWDREHPNDLDSTS